MGATDNDMNFNYILDSVASSISAILQFRICAGEIQSFRSEVQCGNELKHKIANVEKIA